MRTITNRVNTLLLSLRYNYTPVSNYEIQNKPNPVISICLANNDQAYNLQFRVCESLVSFSRMSFPEPQKISRDCFWALPTITVEIYLSSAIESITSCPDHTSNLDIWKRVTVQSSALPSETSHLNCLTIDPDFWAASANKTLATVDSWSLSHHALSLTLETWYLVRWQLNLFKPWELFKD